MHTWPAPTSITSFTDLDSAVFAINAARILICTLDTTGLPLMFVYVTASLLNSTSILIINQKRVTPNSCHYLLLRNIDLQLHIRHKPSLSYFSPYILQQCYNKRPHISSPSISTGLSYSHIKQAAFQERPNLENVKEKILPNYRTVLHLHHQRKLFWELVTIIQQQDICRNTTFIAPSFMPDS